jgi:hypothetical protein
VNDQTAPEWSVVRYEFPARGQSPPVTLTWYDGGKQPPYEVTGARRPPANGTLLVGTRARLFAPELGRPPLIVPRQEDDQIELPASSLPASLGHQAEWLAACKGDGSTGSPFEYAAQLTETCLLGNVAIRAGRTIEWDAETMVIPNGRDAERFLRREYRQGWEVA